MRPIQRKLLIVLSLVFAGNASASDVIQKAEVFLARYVALYHAFDPAAADLYADDAVIQNRRTYPTGEVRQLTLTSTQYKSLIRQTIGLAKQRGDISQYREPKYTQEGDKVLIQIQRYSELKKYLSPMSLIVGPDKSGAWLVHQEITESIP